MALGIIPTRLLFERSRKVNFVKLVKAIKSILVSMFLERSKYVNSVKLAMILKILLVKLFSEKDKVDNLVKLAISSGMLVTLFPYISNRFKNVKLVMALGMLKL